LSKIAFLFPGQGAQTVGMGQQLATELPAAHALFQRANDLLGYDLASICFQGPADELNSTVRSQPGLFVTSLAALEKLKQESPETVEACQAAAGLSLGEFTALVFAGAMDFETGLRVVQLRGEAMQAAADETPSGMVSVLGLEADKLQEVCDQARVEGGVLQIANHLCPGNIVVSGDQASCQAVGPIALAAGAMKSIELAVAGAFHTPIMQSAVEKLTAALDEAEIHAPRIPVVSNVDARPHSDPDDIRQVLIRQVISPVRWEDSLRYLLAEGFNSFYEVGPGKVLRGLMKRVDRKQEFHSTME
jgi:[acyl-carrier-protein] S-malonyltransferase